jgi:hypothetical protein
MQITIGSQVHGSVGLSNPWTEFVKMLPNEIPVPTMWDEEERVMLVGTSLEVCFYLVPDLHYTITLLPSVSRQ